MEQSQSIKALANALMIFHLKVDNIKKDAKNPFFKSSYASLSNILNSISEPLTESGLVVSQFPTGENGLTTILIHTESGEYLKDTYFMHPTQNTPQQVGSCITYQRRYALASILALNIDDDDDGNTATFGGKNPAEAEDNNKKWLNKDTKDFDNAKQKLKDGKITITEIRNHYKVSKEVEKLLFNIN